MSKAEITNFKPNNVQIWHDAAARAHQREYMVKWYAAHLHPADDEFTPTPLVLKAWDRWCSHNWKEGMRWMTRTEYLLWLWDQWCAQNKIHLV